MPPSFPLLFFWPQLSLRSRACKTQGPPPDFHRAFPAQQKQPWLTAAEDTAGVSGEKKHFQQKALDLLFMFKATECGLCPPSPETAFVRVTGTPYHCSSFLGHPTDSSDFICPKLNPAVAPDLPLVFGVSGSGPIRSLDVSLSFLPPVLCCPSPPTPRGPTS